MRTLCGGISGKAGIGHVRYPTSGSSSNREDAQPFITRRPGIVLAHNGNITNVPELAHSLRSRGVHVQSQCDAEPVLLVLSDALTRIRPCGHTTDDVARAVREVFDTVRGNGKNRKRRGGHADCTAEPLAGTVLEKDAGHGTTKGHTTHTCNICRKT